MARHSAPTAVTRSKRRVAVAAGAMVATAAIVAGSPGVATAADSPPPLDPSALLKLPPNVLFGLLPVVPGALPVMLLAPQLAPALAGGAKQWNSIPFIGSQFPATTTSTGPNDLAGGLPVDINFADAPRFGSPSWIPAENAQNFKIQAPLGLGGFENNFYGGLIFPASSLAAILGVSSGDFAGIADPEVRVGSYIGNKTTLSGPGGSSLSTDVYFWGKRDEGNLTSFTPGIKINATAPLGLGNALFTFSPGGITYGPGTFVVTGPSFGVDLTALGLGGSFNLSTGSFGVKDGGLHVSSPTIGLGATTPLGSVTAATTTASATVGLGGASITGPGATGSFDNGKTTTTATVGTGSASVGGDEGTSFTPPSASVTSTPSKETTDTSPAADTSTTAETPTTDATSTDTPTTDASTPTTSASESTPTSTADGASSSKTSDAKDSDTKGSDTKDSDAKDSDAKGSDSTSSGKAA